MITSRKNPKLAVQPTQQDVLLLKIAGFIVVLNFLLVSVFYSYLPKTIPIHFNLKGEADGFGDTSKVWLLPTLSLVLFWVIPLFIKKIKPWNMNYPIKVLTANAPKVYSMHFKMLTQLNIGLTLIFFLLTVKTILPAIVPIALGLHYLVLFLILFSIIRPFHYIFKMYKLPKL